MKPRTLTLTLLAGTLSALPLHAQPPEDHPPAPPPDAIAQGERPPPPPVRRYFEFLKEKDPADYERLQALRNDNPEEYREELAKRLRAGHERHDWKNRWSSENGNRYKQDQRNGQMSGVFFRPERGYSDGVIPNSELEDLEIKILNLARTLRDSTSDEEKANLREELKTEVSKAFDLRQQLRKERLAQMEKRLEHIKSGIETRQSKRDAIIHDRIEELLSDHPDNK